MTGLHEAALLLAVSALGSQVLGLVRDRLLAAAFGAGRQLDIYYAAFRLPDLLYVSIASLISVAVIIPILVKKIQSNESSGASSLLNQLFTIFAAVMALAILVAFFLLPFLTPILAPGFNLAERAELIRLSRILLASPFLLGLSNLFGAVTQSLRRFFVYALSPLLYNLGIIGGILLLYPLFGLPGLAWGVVLGAVLHWLIQGPVVAKSGLWPRLSWRFDWGLLSRVMLISLPRTLALSAHQLVLLVLVALASLMTAGSVAVFNFAFNLQSVPLAIIGVSYSVAAFPTLASLFVNGEKSKFVGQVTAAIRHIVFWSLPAIVLFVVLRAQLVRVILGAGQFDWSDTRLVAAALALFILSAAAQGLVLLLVRGYYASGRTLRPLLINLASSGLIVALAWFLRGWFDASSVFRLLTEKILRVEGVAGSEILTLPLAFSIGVSVNLWLLWLFFQRDFGVFPKIVNLAIFQSALASFLAGLAAYFTLNRLDDWLNLNTFWGVLLQGLGAGLVGLAVLIGVLSLVGNRELKEIFSALRHKIWRARVPAPEPEGL